MIWSILISLAARTGVPERFRKIAAWVAIVVAVLALMGASILAWNLWLGSHDKAVIETENARVELNAAAGREKSADERVVDALKNQMTRDEREKAIAQAEASEAAKAPAERATLPPTTVALNCERLKRAGVTDGAAYKEKCK